MMPAFAREHLRWIPAGLRKSAAGRRTVQLPPLIVPSLRNHIPTATAGASLRELMARMGHAALPCRPRALQRAQAAGGPDRSGAGACSRSQAITRSRDLGMLGR
jgi:hypothetical protein